MPSTIDLSASTSSPRNVRSRSVFLPACRRYRAPGAGSDGRSRASGDHAHAHDRAVHIADQTIDIRLAGAQRPRQLPDRFPLPARPDGRGRSSPPSTRRRYRRPYRSGSYRRAACGHRRRLAPAFGNPGRAVGGLRRVESRPGFDHDHLVGTRSGRCGEPHRPAPRHRLQHQVAGERIEVLSRPRPRASRRSQELDQPRGWSADQRQADRRRRKKRSVVRRVAQRRDDSACRPPRTVGDRRRGCARQGRRQPIEIGLRALLASGLHGVAQMRRH